MLKEVNCTGAQPKRRKQVSLDLPAQVEEYLHKKAKEGYRSLSSEIAMRLTRSVEIESLRPQGAKQ